MRKLRGELHTQNKDEIRPVVSRLSSGAVSSELRLEDHAAEIWPPVAVFTTLGESGGVSVRIEINGKVAINEHWPIAELETLIAARSL